MGDFFDDDNMDDEMDQDDFSEDFLDGDGQEDGFESLIDGEEIIDKPEDINQHNQPDMEDVFIIGSMIAGNAYEEAREKRNRKKKK